MELNYVHSLMNSFELQPIAFYVVFTTSYMNLQLRNKQENKECVTGADEQTRKSRIFFIDDKFKASFR